METPTIDREPVEEIVDRPRAEAWQFLTRIPLPARWRSEHGLSPGAIVYFPGIGWMVGTLTAAVVVFGGKIWPIWVAVLVGLAVEALITGALHEDGLADFCDAFGGGWTRDDVLRILKDSRIGAYGTLALMLYVGLRVATLSNMESPMLMASIMTSAAIGRGAMAGAMALLGPIEGRASLASRLHPEEVRRYAFLATTLTVLAALVLSGFAPLQSLAILVAVPIVVLAFVAYVRKRIGGMTGDCLGALCCIVQVVVLLAASVRLPS